MKLKKQEGKLKDWIKEKELTPDPSRVQVNGFGRSVSQKAVWANKQVQQNIAFQQTLSDRFGIDAKGFETYRGSKSVLDEMVGMIDKLHADFPDDVGKMKLRYADLKNANDFGQYDPKTKAISLNRQLFDDTPLLKSEYEKLVQSGHFPRGTDYKSVIIHEFGHQYDYAHELGTGKILRDGYRSITGNNPSSGKIKIMLQSQVSLYSAFDTGNMDGLKLSDGKIVGLNEQLDTLRKENDYLFESEQQTPRFSAAAPGIQGGASDKKTQLNDALRSALGRQEQ